MKAAAAATLALSALALLGLRLRSKLKQAPRDDRARPATVYLVGAGPGAADLITARGLALIDACDILLSDRLVSPELVERAERRGARIVSVGKSASKDRLKQDAVDDLLVILALELGEPGVIVRLKGGDPFVYGLGGNEMVALNAAKVPCVVVPGLSSALAVPCLANVPLTHKNVSAGFTVLSGHDACRGPEWSQLPRVARPACTLVVLMIAKNLSLIADFLLGTLGWDGDLPARLVQNGSTPGQRIVSAPLGLIAAQADIEKVTEAPLILIVGESCSLFSPPPPRPLQQAGSLSKTEWGKLGNISF